MWYRLFRQSTSHHRPRSDQYQGTHRVVHVLRHLAKRCAAFLIPGLFLGKFSNRQIVNKNAPGFIMDLFIFKIFECPSNIVQWLTWIDIACTMYRLWRLFFFRHFKCQGIAQVHHRPPSGSLSWCGVPWRPVRPAAGFSFPTITLLTSLWFAYRIH